MITKYHEHQQDTEFHVVHLQPVVTGYVDLRWQRLISLPPRGESWKEYIYRKHLEAIEAKRGGR